MDGLPFPTGSQNADPSALQFGTLVKNEHRLGIFIGTDKEADRFKEKRAFQL